jgi:tRNA threonylcarbamoyl adenosine modification protein YjeE
MTASLVLPDIDEQELRLLAELLALHARPGDTIALSGELGAGKTTFARAFVRALLGDPEAEVPSPTFTLVQTYDAARFPVAHFDLYRLSSGEEVAELGLDEALTRGVVVVEWPERAWHALPASRLEIRLEDGSSPELRNLKLVAHGGWSSKLARLEQVLCFCAEHVGAEALRRARVTYLQGDASPRAYARIARDQSTLVLMDAPRMPDGPPIRDGLPYSRIAHLAEDVRPFVAVARALTQRGLAAPHIEALDMDAGLLLLEDLGDQTFGRALEAGYAQAELWRTAVDALVSLRRSGPPGPLALPTGEVHALPHYDRQALSIETELLLDWYWPALNGAPAPATAWTEFRALWNAEFDILLELPKGWILRDYHSPNLMWRPQRQGIGRVGILDFQDALSGPWAFDLVSLLQDARVDVPAELEAELFDYYCRQVAAIEPDFDRTSFAHAYSVLGAQRNTKILGIFARLAKRDGKPAYLHHIPRIWRYLERDLSQPSLAALRDWYDRNFPTTMRTRVLSL